MFFAVAAAAQQPQEKRIALVVGEGAYAKAPLATAANDAGLIAQTLQAAGFDVIGARDLDADSLRKSFRDFVQKLQVDPANTVAILYLAGYGVQLSGENYFIPVDSNVTSATDIPIEGLRISDYTRELSSIPVKASVVVLDASREQPFVTGPQPLAGGLSLVEASPNMLIAFNAAPGTVAPTEAGSYGIYAQSLAEMIRTGGLSLPDVFDRVRLRVSENSKGAQVPWDDQKIEAQFSFFDRAPEAPPLQGPPDQVAAMRDKPMRDLSVQDAYAAALDRDTMQGYEDFLVAYPNDPMARRARAILAARREAITWRRTYLSDTPQAYWSYLRRYPDGPHAWDARRRLANLNALLEPPSSFAMIDYDVPPPPPDEIVYVDRPVFYFGDPEFGFVPPPPPPVYFLPPPPPDFVVLAPPLVAVGLFLLPRPMFVPMPVFVRPPVYIAPPPNNIIFNNIHNTTVINNVINQPPRAPGTQGGTGAAPALPAAVAQRASLIQQGRLPPPPSAAINVTAKPGTPSATPVVATPSQQQLRKENALPVPGTKGTPPAPAGAAAPGAATPGARQERPTAREQKLNPAAPGKPPVAQTQPATPAAPEKRTSTQPPPPRKPEARRATLPPPPPKPATAAPKPAALAKPAPPPPKPATAAPPPPRPAALAKPAPPPPSPPAAALRSPAPRLPQAPKPPPPRPASAAKRCPPNAKC